VLQASTCNTGFWLLALSFGFRLSKAGIAEARYLLYFAPMKKSLFLSMLALSALVFSCKKDDDKSPAELIVGKWNLVSYTDNDYYDGSDHKTTGNYATGAYIVEFTSSGKQYERHNGWIDSALYKVEGSKLIIDTYDTLIIKSISGSDMQTYSKEITGASSYAESTNNFRK
jgi:hypothetical protein